MGFAAVFPNTTSGGRLTGQPSVFTAELYAINAAVHEILKGTIDGNRVKIFSDSRSALLALRSDSSFSPIVVETKEKYVRMTQEMYRNAYSRVRSSVGETEGFEVKVGLHQGLALSPFIFNNVVDVITQDLIETVTWCILYADDIVLCAERREDLEVKLERWRAALEGRGMRISRSKTEYMCASIDGDGGDRIRMDGEEIKKVHKFKYLGAMVDASGSMDEEVRHRIQTGWNNLRSASGVLCDRVPLKLKGKFHKTVIRPAMLYGTETASMKKTGEKDGRSRNENVKMDVWSNKGG